MKRVMWVSVGLLLLAVFAVLIWWPDPEETRLYWKPTDRPEMTEVRSAGDGVETAAKASEGSPVAARLNAPDGDGQKDVEALHELVVQYLQALQRRQGPPIGDDVDLAKVLTGKNPFKRPVMPVNHSALSADGHLRDRWGTPYHVHANSSTSFQIRSAGPDRKLFTTDDLVAPK